MRKITNIVLLCLCVFVLSTGCAELSENSAKKDELAGKELKTEAVKEEIKKGMVRDDVEGILGVTQNVLTDNKGRGVTIHDRVSAIDVTLDSSDRDTLLLIGLGKEEDDTAKGRKNFTITIRYDRDDRVYDFDFGLSKF